MPRSRITNNENKEVIGILVNNLGTPDSYEVADVRRYLKQFLSDPRVIKVPRIIWWFILNLVILPTRPKKSAHAYSKVWTKEGSPLLTTSQKLTDKLSQFVNTKWVENNLPNTTIALGMRYGKPSIESALNQLKQNGATRYIVMPMYPQYSYTTTASIKDALFRVFDKWGNQPPFKIICDYHQDPLYIDAITQTVNQHWSGHGKADKLLMSFHGIPQQYADDGDPYPDQCHRTASLLADALKLDQSQWQITFQSRLGPKKWLEPYTDKTVQRFAQQGIQSIQVVCPGFSVDCLETLEEVAMENKQIFLDAGGKRYEYIACLNDNENQIALLSKLIAEKIN